ncbi:MAG: thioredoxin domain-containing protein, partial [Mycobacterium sp.]
MRYWWVAIAMTAVCLFTPGLGSAVADAPGTSLSADHYGVVAGSADAPVQLEIFCDPQCPDCAQFESVYGEQIGRGIGSGQLAVTYRWLTFLDAKKHNDTSARVSNALFTAAEPATPATAYQNFVADLYRHRDATGAGPAASDIAVMARESGVPDVLADRIADGDPSV